MIRNQRQKHLIFSVIASLLSLIFLAFGFRKKNSSLAAAREWLSNYMGEKISHFNDYLEDELHSDVSLIPKFEKVEGSSMVKVSWNNDGSKYYVLYVSKKPFPENFKSKKTYPDLLTTSQNIKNFIFDYQTVYEYDYSTVWIRKIVLEEEQINEGQCQSFFMDRNFYFVMGSEKGAWSSYLTYPKENYPKVDILKDLQVCYEKKERYYLLHLIFGPDFRTIPCSDLHILVKASTQEIYTYPLGDLKESLSVKLKNSNGGLCYLCYFNDFEEQIIKFLEYIPETYNYRNHEWYGSYLSLEEE